MPNVPRLREPACIECGSASDLVKGSVIYPHRPDLHALNFWKCPKCPSSYVGCHKPGSGREALGLPCGPETRKARSYVHRVLDPMWKDAPQSAAYEGSERKAQHIIRAVARKRVYAYLRDQMKLSADDCHVSHFSIDKCRQAYAILKRTSYEQIRDWARDQYGPA